MRSKFPACLKKSIINVYDSNSGAYAGTINLMRSSFNSVQRASVTRKQVKTLPSQ